MAEPLKYLYDPLFFERLCPVFNQTIPGFDRTRFIHRVFDHEWPDLELKERTRKVTVSLRKFMPDNFALAAELIVKISKTIRNNNGTEMSYPFIFLPDYIEVYGLDHYEESLWAIENVTQLISAEFAIRPFILKYPDKVMDKMVAWSKHTDHRVRRLASEGCRPRLPWAIGLPLFKENPSPILPILENLKKDQSDFVRRSVANNLNDIAKDHPEIVLNIAKKWKGISPETNWILKHGSRTLLKQGHNAALSFHGFDQKVRSEISKLKMSSSKIRIGQSAPLQFVVKSNEKKKTLFRIEYAITFLTSTGKSSRKVFKVSEKEFKPLEKIHFLRSHRFQDFTTRKHYPGKHKIEIIVNGKSKKQLAFDLSK